MLVLTSLCLCLSVLWALDWKLSLLQTTTHGSLSYFRDSIQETNSISHINTVHVVFSNHLDIGFHSNITGVPGTDRAVISRYFQHHFPAAIATANSLRSKDYDTIKLLGLHNYKDILDSNEARSLNSTHRYRYLTHAWLVSLYLDCPAWLGESCPSEKERQIFREAIYRGDITWHALPHNCEVFLLMIDVCMKDFFIVTDGCLGFVGKIDQPDYSRFPSTAWSHLISRRLCFSRLSF